MKREARPRCIASPHGPSNQLHTKQRTGKTLAQYKIAFNAADTFEDHKPGIHQDGK
jgi:hypothetical protein